MKNLENERQEMGNVTPITAKLLTMRELAPLLGLSEKAATRAAGDGSLEALGIHPVKLRGAWRVRRSEVEQALAPQPHPPAPAAVAA